MRKLPLKPYKILLILHHKKVGLQNRNIIFSNIFLKSSNMKFLLTTANLAQIKEKPELGVMIVCTTNPSLMAGRDYRKETIS